MHIFDDSTLQTVKKVLIYDQFSRENIPHEQNHLFAFDKWAMLFRAQIL